VQEPGFRGNFDTTAAFTGIICTITGERAEERMNAKNGDLGGTGADGEQVKEHLRAAKDAAASAARARAYQAREWASSRIDDLQHSVEARPYAATAWALGVGFLAGVLLMGLVRGTRR
jgi:ElaB/YqjD/DUF883 family membrane-anchored ribosome-binding protein